MNQPVIVAASTSGLPEREKFDFWREVVGRTLIDLECQQADRRVFDASVSGVSMDGLSVVRIAGSPHRVLRTPSHGTASNDSLILNFIVSGHMVAEQDGRDTLLLPGDGAICDAERPYRLHLGEAFELVSVKLPRTLLGHSLAVRRTTATGFSKAGALGPVLYAYVDNFSRQITMMNAGTTTKLFRNLADLVATALYEFDPDSAIRPHYRSVVLSRIKDYVEQHLDDADLGPSEVARALNLTPRHINKLLETEGTSLSRYLWNRRLERAAEDLANPSEQSKSISDIAFRLGFNDMSHFSRSFRQRFANSPRDFRAGSPQFAPAIRSGLPKPRSAR